MNPDELERWMGPDNPPDEVRAALLALQALALQYPSVTGEVTPQAGFSEKKYQLLLEQIPAVTFSADLRGGLSDLYVSPQIERLLGFTQAEWLEDPVRWYRQLHDDDKARWTIDFAQIVVSAEPFEGIYRFIAKNGRVVWVRGAINFIRDETKRPRFLQGVAFDLTEIKESEEKTLEAERVLREAKEILEIQVEERTAQLKSELAERLRAEARFRTAVEAAPNAMMVADGSGTIVLVNRQLESLFRYEPGELVGQKVEILVPLRFRDAHPKLRASYRDEAVARRMGEGRDLFGVRKDGTEIPVEIGLTPERSAGGMLVISSIVDITQRLEKAALLKHQAERLERSNRELESFARVVSHDLQAPLRRINNYSQLLDGAIRKGTDASLAQTSGYVERISDSVERMRTLINDLLTYSRVSSSTATEEVDLNEVVEAVIRDLGPQLEESGGSVVVAELPTLSIRRVHMQQLFQNLIGNAIKFRKTGVPPRVEVTAAIGDGVLSGAVMDNGIGIPSDQAEKVFLVFQRLHTDEAYEGTGVGLSICKKVIDLYDGAIEVRPNSPHGSKFQFTLRLPT